MNKGRISYTHQENGGALYLKVQNSNFLHCYFLNNSNLQGGVFYFGKNEKAIDFYMKMSKCIFLKNDAGEGGAGIYISKGIKYMIGNITSCYFANAIAWSTF